MIKAPFTLFGITKNIPVKVIENGKFNPNASTWDVEYFVERQEDLYGIPLNKKVRIVTREDWLFA